MPFQFLIWKAADPLTEADVSTRSALPVFWTVMIFEAVLLTVSLPKEIEEGEIAKAGCALGV